MTYPARPSNYGAQLAYHRDIAARGLAAVLAPYSLRPAVTIPAQRRRVVERERIGA